MRLDRLGKAISERFEVNEPRWDQDQEASWTGEQIGRRVSRLVQLPLQAVAQLGDLVVGSARVLVGGDHKQLHDGGNLVADLFFNALRVINPDAQRKGDVHGGKVRLLSKRVKDVDLRQLGLGPVAIRLAFLLRGLLLVVTRIIDLIVGMFAAGCALASVGQDEEINGAAYEGLKAPRLLGDLLETLVLVIDPNSA